MLSEKLTSSDLMITVSSKKSIRILTCPSCHLTQACGSFVPSELVEEYSKVIDPEFEKECDARKSSFSTDLRKMKSLLPENIDRVLEIGPFTGIGAEAIREVLRPQSYLGIEPSKWACEIAQRRGFEVRQGQVGIPLDERFDLICSWDVIEHLEDPKLLFSWARRHSANKSYLFLSTPNWNSLSRRLLGQKWWFVEPMHRVYFTAETIKKMAEQSDWQCIAKWNHRKTLSLNYFVSRGLRELGMQRLSTIGNFLPRLNIGFPMGQMGLLFRRTGRIDN